MGNNHHSTALNTALQQRSACTSARMDGNSILQDLMRSCVHFWVQESVLGRHSLLSHMWSRNVLSFAPVLLYLLPDCHSSSALLHPANSLSTPPPWFFSSGQTFCLACWAKKDSCVAMLSLFSFHGIWEERSVKRTPLSPAIQIWSTFPSSLVQLRMTPSWEQSVCTPSFRALNTAGECNEHLAGLLRNSHFHRNQSAPDFWLNNNVWENIKCCAFALH